MWQKLKEIFIVEVLALAHAIMRFTWKRQRGELAPEIAKRIDAGQPVIFGHLHQDDVSLTAFFVGYRVGVLVSHSKDGNLLARLFQKIGWRVARGSSSRGAASGFLELLRYSREEKLSWITFAVDGPRGPLGKSKNGIFKLASLLEAPVVPVVSLATKRWTFSRSWSKTFIPKPFATVQAKFLEPIPFEEIQKYVSTKNYSSLTAMLDARIAQAKAGYF